ncbi:hypothetical protein ACGFYQ_27505 [Streptomyces sp. NPDC048258]|uniref:hypothetical protein n=1 Tax=Streptomyces sp. NPDC048258 TaxID=3365527 RepID=UPI003711D3BD
MCTACGWTYSMVCLECAGCGCYTGQCSGWRHNEYAGDTEDGEPFCDDDDCEGCDDYSPYGLTYGEVG